MKKTFNYKKKGVTLLELLMVVGIAAVIAVSALIFFRSTDEANRISSETKNLGTLSAGIANMFTAQGNYEGLNNQVLLSSHVIPESMRVGTSTTDIRHSWLANGVTIGPTNISVNNDAFFIQYQGVPQRSCVDIVTKTVTSFHQIRIGTGNIAPGGGGPATGGTEVTNVAQITSACSGTSNTILWVR